MYTVNDIKVCSIPVDRALCEDARLKCADCPNNSKCDCYWVSNLWIAENKEFKKDTLLGPFNPAFVKPDFRANHVISVSGKYDFCCFNVPKKKDIIVIGDLYVDKELRGQGISKIIFTYLINTYNRDIFAKCVRGTSAEDFWKHIGTQINANINNPNSVDFYEHRPGKRDLGWYMVDKKYYLNHKSIEFENLWG